MKGASGARISLYGDYVYKLCEDAEEQVKWFELAKGAGLVEGLRLPTVTRVASVAYNMEFVRGHLATAESSVMFLEACIRQIEVWSNTPAATNGDWESYLRRLREHVSLCPTKEMDAALGLFKTASPFPTSFCHGDFTLENILLESDGTCVLIDPNFKKGLFQSYVLDLGKLLQSTHARYHTIFASNDGVDLSRHNTWLKQKLKEKGLWRQSLLACISHIIRLRKYRPEEQKPLVDSLLRELTAEYERRL
jgi:thiamine kinase-like enzyme